MSSSISVCNDVNNYIYTIEEKCVGCNKCIRGCPAIYANVAYKINDQSKIMVDQTKCIRCGHCLDQCDHGARDYYDDTERFFDDLKAGKAISVIAAPSVRFNFDNYQALFGYLKRIGVNLIYDVSFGADITTWAYLKAIQDFKLDSVIAQPCPAIVNYIEKYKPSLLEKLAPVHSPALCTAIYMQEYENVTDKIAFLSPCIAKVEEFHDPNTEQRVAYNITYKKVKDYIEKNQIRLRGCDELDYDDIGCGLGLTFSRPGGLKENVLYHFPEAWVRQVEGSEYAYGYLKNYEKRLQNNEKLPLLVDILNCAHGCNLGTATQKDIGIDDVDSKMEVLKSSKLENLTETGIKKLLSKKKSPYPLFDFFNSKLDFKKFIRKYQDKTDLIVINEPTPSHKDAIYLSLHKHTPESREINCFSCGYGSCEKLVRAIFNQTNHKENCINYNRAEVEIEKQDLIYARNKAEEAEKARSQFLANMSHEIRTPMNGIIGYIQLLSETELTEEQNDFAHEAAKSADLLLYLINDILDFSKIEAGKMVMESIDFNLRSVIEDVATLATSQAHKKGIEVNALINSELPSKVKGDAGRLKQVLNNLVGNAVKFTKEGEVLIKVRKISEDNNNIVILFEVNDTGVGIPENMQTNIFDAFTQADTSATRKFGGTGLGLAISQSIVELMHGTIKVKSEVGMGSTFSFTARFDRAEQEESLPNPSLETLRDRHILIVDDNRTNLNIARHYLESVECRISVAISSKQALRELKSSQIKTDVIIIDYQMPDEDGFGLARTLKSSEEYKHIPLILLSSIASKGEHMQARDIGFCGYLTKPVKKEDLIKCVSIVLSQPEPMAVSAEKPEVITRHTLKEQRYHDRINILLVEDNVTNQKLTVQVLKKLNINCDIAQNGLEALDAYRSKHYDLILMDCQMPEMDGYEATKKIRQLENNSEEKRHIPIIAITANAMAGDAEKCLKAGMDFYLSKPVDKNKLIATIKEFIPVTNPMDKENNETDLHKEPLEKKQEQVVNTENPSKEELFETINISDLPVIKEESIKEESEDLEEVEESKMKSVKTNLKDIDQKDFNNFVSLLMNAFDFSHEEAMELLSEYLESLSEAIVKLHIALKQKNYQDIITISHTLKGSSSNLRIDKMKELFINLENSGENKDKTKCSKLLKKIEKQYDYIKSHMT